MNPLDLIPAPYRIAAIAAVVIVFGGTCYYKGHASAAEACAAERAKDTAVAQRALLDAAARARAAEDLAAQRLATIDQHYKDLQRAQTDNEALRRKLADGSLRVRLPARAAACVTGTASAASAGVGDGKAGCELDPAAASALAGIAADGDRAIRKMTALQDYVEQVVLPTCGATN